MIFSLRLYTSTKSVEAVEYASNKISLITKSPALPFSGKPKLTVRLTAEFPTQSLIPVNVNVYIVLNESGDLRLKMSTFLPCKESNSATIAGAILKLAELKSVSDMFSLNSTSKVVSLIALALINSGETSSFKTPRIELSFPGVALLASSEPFQFKFSPHGFAASIYSKDQPPSFLSSS